MSRDTSLYFFNDQYDAKVIDQGIFDLKNKLYQRALEAQSSMVNFETIYGTMQEFTIDTEINNEYDFPAGTYTYLMKKDIVPYYNKKRFINKYAYNTPLTLIDIMNDHEIFSRRIVFMIDKYLFLMLKLVSIKDNGTLLAIFPNSTDGISSETLHTFIINNFTWTLSIEDQSDFYYTYKIKTMLFTENANTISINKMITKSEFDKSNKPNKYNIAISASAIDINLLVQSNATLGVEADLSTPCFNVSEAFKNYIMSNSNNCKCFVFNSYNKLGDTFVSRYSMSTLDIGTTEVGDISYGNGIYVGTPIGRTYVITSYDKKNWTIRETLSSLSLYSICFGNDIFIATSSTSSTEYLTSSDGINWTSRTFPQNKSMLYVYFGNDIFIATSSTSSTEYLTSSDGINWTSRTFPQTGIWNAFCYNNDIFVAITKDGTAIMTSSDGINWTPHSSPIMGNISEKLICYGNGIFVAISSTSIIYTSTDGINWESKTAPLIKQWRSLAYGDGIFVAIHASAAPTADVPKFILSTDGINWGIEISPVTQLWRNVFFHDRTFILSGIKSQVVNINVGKFIQIPYVDNPISIDNIIVWGYDSNNDIKLLKRKHDIIHLYPNVYNLNAFSEDFSNYVEWNSVFIEPIKFDNNIKEYINCYPTSYIDMIRGNAPNVLLNYTPLKNFNYDFDDYLNHPDKGDLRGYKLSKLIELLMDNGIRYKDISIKVRVRSRRIIIATYDLSKDTFIYNRNVNDTSSQITNPNDIISFIEPHTYITISNTSNINRDAIMFIDGKRVCVTAVSTENGKTYVYIPKSKITASSKIIIEVPLIGTTGLTKHTGEFTLYELNTYMPFPNTDKFDKVDSEDLIFYDSETHAYIEKSSFDYGLYVKTVRILTDKYDIKFHYSSSSDISYLQTQLSEFFLTSNEQKIELLDEKTLIKGPKTFNKKIDSKDTVIATNYLPLLNREISVTNTDNYRMVRINDLSISNTISFINFKEDPSPDRFKVYINGKCVDNTHYSYTPPTYYGGEAKFTITSYETQPGINDAIIEYYPIKEKNILYSTIDTNKVWWVEKNINLDEEIYSISFGAGIFIAIPVGTENHIYTSKNGVNWTKILLSDNKTWKDVCYGDGKFVAIAWPTDTNTVTQISTDGITWTSHTIPEVIYWSSITYGNGLFVTVGGLNSFMTSPDGITWTERTIPVTATWSSIVYGNGLFVVIASSTSSILTSPDGITWTEVVLPISPLSNPRSVAYGNGIFVIAGFSNFSIVTSPDGITWTERTIPINRKWDSVVFADNKFAVVSYDGDYVMTSMDGITWEYFALSSNNIYRSMTYGNGIFISLGNAGNSLISTGYPILFEDSLFDLTILTDTPFNKEINKVYLDGLRISPDDIVETGLCNVIKINGYTSDKIVKIDVPTSDDDCYEYNFAKPNMLMNRLLWVDENYRNIVNQEIL